MESVPLKVYNWFAFCILLFLCHTTVKELSLSNYLPLDGERIVELLPFPTVKCKTASLRMWTQAVLNIS